MTGFPASVLCDAHPSVRIASSRIRPLSPGMRLAGRVQTVRTPIGQNAAVHRAVHVVDESEVLVIDAGADTGFGYFGEILATACVERSVAGIVLDGSVRDVAALDDMRFPVFCVGSSPVATAKTNRGEVGIQIECGGVTIRPGDYVSADDDGVAFVAGEMVDAVLSNARAIMEREDEILRWVGNGVSTCEILGIDP